MNSAIVSIATSSANALLVNVTKRTKTTCVDCVQQIDSMATIKQRVIVICFFNHQCDVISHFGESGNSVSLKWLVKSRTKLKLPIHLVSSWYSQNLVKIKIEARIDEIQNCFKMKLDLFLKLKIGKCIHTLFRWHVLILNKNVDIIPCQDNRFVCN